MVPAPTVFSGAVMEKLAFEISKKILLLACTLMRAVVIAAGRTGIVTGSVPSLGVAVSRVMGNVRPPSVDSRMSTLAQLTGAAVVLFTLHVTVWGVLPG